jgi:tungstate transport system substrate-binding protein
MRLKAITVFAVASTLMAAAAAGCSGEDELILATTTSTQDSGLLDELVPAFETQYDYKVKVIAVGSGQALALGEAGEADVLLVHSPKAEEEFMSAGNGEDRLLVMHNDFVIVGPSSDPAGIGRADSAAAALALVAGKEAAFFSRGDESGTHSKELSLWEKANAAPGGTWYQETGQGMGATLGVASEKQGYTLTDRGTYLALRDDLDLAVLYEGDSALNNIYHVIVVNPEKHGEVNAEAARAFAAFITSPETQNLIREFGVEKYGEPLFAPDAAAVEGATPAP